MEKLVISNLTNDDIGRLVEYKRGKIKETGCLKTWNMFSIFLVMNHEPEAELQNEEAMAVHPDYCRFIKKNVEDEKEN